MQMLSLMFLRCETSKDAVLVAAVGGRVGFGLGQRAGVRPAGAPRRRQKLEHGLVVLGQHLGQVARHRVRPEKVVVQRRVGVDALRRVQRQQLVQQVARVRILHVGLQPLCKKQKRAPQNKIPMTRSSRPFHSIQNKTNGNSRPKNPLEIVPSGDIVYTDAVV